jgi:hypothetical protein
MAVALYMQGCAAELKPAFTVKGSRFRLVASMRDGTVKDGIPLYVSVWPYETRYETDRDRRRSVGTTAVVANLAYKTMGSLSECAIWDERRCLQKELARFRFSE